MKNSDYRQAAGDSHAHKNDKTSGGAGSVNAKKPSTNYTAPAQKIGGFFKRVGQWFYDISLPMLILIMGVNIGHMLGKLL